MSPDQTKLAESLSHPHHGSETVEPNGRSQKANLPERLRLWSKPSSIITDPIVPELWEDRNGPTTAMERDDGAPCGFLTCTYDTCMYI